MSSGAIAWIIPGKSRHIACMSGAKWKWIYILFLENIFFFFQGCVFFLYTGYDKHCKIFIAHFLLCWFLLPFWNVNETCPATLTRSIFLEGKWICHIFFWLLPCPFFIFFGEGNCDIFLLLSLINFLYIVINSSFFSYVVILFVSGVLYEKI